MCSHAREVMLDYSLASQQHLRMSPCHAAPVHQCRQFSKYIEGAYFAYGKFSYQLTHDEAMALCKAFSPQAYQTLMQVRLSWVCLRNLYVATHLAGCRVGRSKLTWARPRQPCLGSRDRQGPKLLR